MAAYAGCDSGSTSLLPSSSSPASSSRYICKFCLDNICNSTREWNYHHKNYSSLVQSASEQCTFCTTLLGDIDLRFHDPAHKEKLQSSDCWPLYRWNLRRQAYLRECQEVIVLTFRAIVPSKPVEILALCEFLPDRTFHFYVEADLGPLPSRVGLGNSTNSEQTWVQIHEWMNTCLEKHERCRRKRQIPDSLPTRLLDLVNVNPVGSDHSHVRVRVVETSTLQEKRPYMTLSHYWGEKPNFLELNNRNYHEITTVGFRWDHPKLPPNFKDAMIVARKLDIRYIWIDSLCIVQKIRDDPNDLGEDFHREGYLMHKYYRNSFCNVCAADSGTLGLGLFRQRDLINDGSMYASRIIPATLVPENGHKLFRSRWWRVVSDSLWNERLLSNVLYFRAWVFQERMLAPRILHFSKHQVFWECSTLSACEGLPSGIPGNSDATARTDRRWRTQLQSDLSLKHRPLAGEEDASMETLWKNAVRRYTSCNMKKETDKLTAIWSVAKLVADALQESYAVGLWAKRLEDQLAWRVVDCQQFDGSPSERIKIDGVPSWSWASIRGVIELQDRSHGGGNPEWAYRVVGFHGEKIEFHLKKDAKPAGNEDPDQSRVDHHDGKGTELHLKDNQIPAGGNKSPNTPKAVDADGEDVKFHLQHNQVPAGAYESLDEPRPLDRLTIAIRGYLRRGQLIKSVGTGGWSLSIDQQDKSLTDENGGPIILPEAFPDVTPEGDLPTDCWLVVLAYSLFGEDAYSGIGLLLEKVKANTFRRTGSFRFRNITSHELSFLIVLSDHKESKSFVDSGTPHKTNLGQTTEFLLT